MCGIVGAYDLTGLRDFPRNRLQAMTKTVAHRGPDDESLYFEPGIALGVRRLAIVDLQHGHQPVSNHSETIWTIFNGELFDYKKIRHRLLQQGHTINTHCDTELWIHLYEIYGDEMFEHTLGQFAVCVWDRQARKLLLGRDRMGICPLYYTISDGWLLWSSEIKPLFASGLVARTPDRKAIDYLFNFSCAPTKRTFFENIHLLPPGYFLRAQSSSITLHQYWDLNFPDIGEERLVSDPEQLVGEFESLLTEAVTRRLQADVPVVSYLSSGLDSSTVLGLSNQQAKNPLPAFTIGLEQAGPDERKQSIEAANFLGSPITIVPINQNDLANAFPELISSVEGPILDTSCAALMVLAKEVHRQGFKVVLTGEGADEALAGYIWFKTQKISDWMGSDISRWLNKSMQFILGANKQGTPIPYLGINGVRPAQQYMYEALSFARDSLYSDDLWMHLKGHNPYDDLDIHNKNMQRWHPLNQSLYVGYKVMLAGLLMIAKGDRIAMHSSVETRYPFLDEDVVRFCSEISPIYKLNGLKEKWLLRQVAAKTCSKEIAERPKTMFRAKLSHIFLNPDRPAWVDQLLSPESLNRAGYFNPIAVTKERRLQETLPHYLPRRLVLDAALTCVISTQLWHHLFFDGGLCDLPAWNFSSRS